MKEFGGKALFLDRNDINTDEIIPAKYLTENTKLALQPYILEDLKLGGFDPRKDIEGKGVIVTRANFGCGSSREHAVWVFEVNDINVVIAESFARIFRQNMYNCGMLAIELPKKDIETLFGLGKEVKIGVDLAACSVTAQGSKKVVLPFKLNEFDKKLVEAGGWLAYADKNY
ncbi:MAG: 3-isopropylmalate dehydratase small subunit [Desulfurivibrionaceae bacterium]|jgi:3-isopropylmalate/(R)-2-methylmalate dehydratase small subunit|nr:3-isopropylmalate dehydratase small subunit [Pseudomonadota bacterium]MCG2824439.1 3-isopropylmalate dehydratase small subunit [Desulfobulbaceae bacterium]MDP2001298.1 3-isopropylmalate dehydratase small subunit [Desulfurivibrionaceae bacterium]PKN17455.1 MAG: 3-isopropylmalate dehydratase small subunit [Deltaproteobacteria bacterium HGW-Deltaproteobacteria-3]MBU4407696.1 3-isopropylmalate dehydratase small subunit [Pseudomonadota bacterium]